MIWNFRSTKPKQQQVSLAITVSVPREVVEDAKSSSTGLKAIEYAVQGVVDALVSGGIVIDPRNAERIRRFVPDANPEVIADNVERANGKHLGREIVEVTVDPSFRIHLENLYKLQGRSIKDILQDVVNMAIHRGWVYSAPPNVKAVYLTMDQAKKIADRLGIPLEKLNGEELMRLL